MYPLNVLYDWGMTAELVHQTIPLIEMDAQAEAEFNGVIAACYRRNPPLPIRTLDALHLASARVSGQTELVGTDKRLRDAAKLLGFSLFLA